MNSKCILCPRACGVDRSLTAGFCGQTNKIRVARAALHMWEEPCISGTRGSGAVFFCGCNLKCVYCQNIEISRGTAGAEISVPRLSEIFLELAALGAHNINLVTPTHYTLQIAEAAEAVRGKLNIPVVYNCGGYESAEGLNAAAEFTDIFLTDMKYADNALAKKYSGASDYCETALAALEKMLTSAGSPEFDKDGIMTGGVIVRHLVLPSHRRHSITLLRRLKDNFGTDSFILSLMSQFTPNGALSDFPEINRRLTTFEYRSVTEAALDLGFKNAYMQERGSALGQYLPNFDLTGVSAASQNDSRHKN